MSGKGLFGCLVILAMWPDGAGAQSAAGTLTVGGAVERPAELRAAELATMPRARAELTVAEGRRSYEGVLLRDVLLRVGAPLGERMRGRALAAYVIAEAEDGYRVVFSLGELDAALGDKAVLVADRAEGEELGPEEGPYRLIVPGERRLARSVQRLKRLHVAEAAAP